MPKNLDLDRSQIGETLKAWREKAKLTQAEAAQALGVASITVSRWERGVVIEIEPANMAGIARVYDVALTDVFALLGIHDKALVTDVPRGTRDTVTRFARITQERAATKRAADRTRRAEQFEREMIRLGANDYEADHVRVRARSFLESVLSSGGTEDAVDEEALDREFDIYLQNSLRLWVIDQMKKRGATPNVLGPAHRDGRHRDR